MNVLIPLAVVAAMFLAAWFGAAAGFGFIFGVVVPYAAAAVFAVGVGRRVMMWAAAPVPFRITTTCGQQKSLPWLPRERFDNPFTRFETVVRMALEVLLFRSLLKNTKTAMTAGRRLVYGTDPWLWLGAMAFHWSFLAVILRHARLFAEPTPRWVTFLQSADGFFQVGVPVYYVSSFTLIAGLGYLLARRLVSPQLRYISLANDYFPLFLLIGIGVSGFWLRYVDKTDVTAIKELAMGLAAFAPVVPEGISPLFFGHLFLVSALFAYFPFSKLMHAAGVFLSPTRNLANNNRAVRHVNPWDYPVKVHTYEEYEDEFREKMKSAGIPVEKE
ncbi:MAG: sulfate reduction electron transfer complex DsrMKJOP subunit DsrM [bacterium]